MQLVAWLLQHGADVNFLAKDPRGEGPKLSPPTPYGIEHLALAAPLSGDKTALDLALNHG